MVLLASWSPAPDEIETIVDFRFLTNCSSLCCILSGGDIVLIRVETEAYEDRVEIIGNVEGGVLAAEWTMDEEILAIASGAAPILARADIRTIKITFHDPGIRDHH